MAPAKKESKSPAVKTGRKSKSPGTKGGRERSTSRARSKSPARGRQQKVMNEIPPLETPKAAKVQSEPAKDNRVRSKSPGRKAKVPETSPSPARGQKKAGRKSSLSPPAKKTASPPRKKRASTPPRKTRSPSPRAEKKQLRDRKSVTPAVDLKAEITSVLAKKVHDLREGLTKGSKEKVVTVTTEVTVSKKKEEKTIECKRKGQCEFCGPVATFLLTLIMPALVLAVNISCTKKSCSVTTIPDIPKRLASYYDQDAILLFIGWFLVQAFLAILPIGRVKEGFSLASGKRLKYRCNGFVCLLLSGIGLGGLVYQGYNVIYIINLRLPLLTLAIVAAFVLSVFLYIRSRYRLSIELAPSGNTGNLIYDHFVGRELNPRIGSFDIKVFLKMHFAPITWALLNATILLKVYKETNALPPLPILLVAGSQLLYVADNLWYEENVVSTMDIASDGLGFMTVLINTVWVPFLYTVQSRYLLEHPQEWPYWALGAFLVLYLIGHIVYRGSNWQKHVFLSDPHHRSVSTLESIPATGGQRILAGGWWALCRHPNYLGDLIMALAWSLPCGFDTPLPYVYPVTLLFLLIHRASRDHKKCANRFGAAWDKYSQRVKYRIIPFIY